MQGNKGHRRKSGTAQATAPAAGATADNAGSSAGDPTAGAQSGATAATSASAPAPPSLTGTYTGAVYYPVGGLFGEATLTVTDGDRFTLQQGANSRTGTLRRRDRITAVMKFDDPNIKSLSLHVAGAGNRLTLKNAPGDPQSFEFRSGARAADIRNATRGAKALSHDSAVTTIAFSPDGTRMASGSHGEIFLWDTARGSVINSLPGVSNWVKSVAFSRSGKLAAAVQDGTVNLYNVTDGTLLGSLPGAKGLSTLAFSRDGLLLAGVGDNGKLLVWELGSQELSPPREIEGSFRSVAFSPVGSLLAGGSTDGNVTLWDTTSFTQTDQWKASEQQLNALAFSRDGKLLASGGRDRNVNLWWIEKGAHTPTPRALVGHEDSITSLSFSSDNKTLASASLDKKVILWEVATGGKSGEQDTGSAIYAVAFLPNRRTFATGGTKDGIVSLWDAK